MHMAKSMACSLRFVATALGEDANSNGAAARSSRLRSSALLLSCGGGADVAPLISAFCLFVVEDLAVTGRSALG